MVSRFEFICICDLGIMSLIREPLIKFKEFLRVKVKERSTLVYSSTSEFLSSYKELKLFRSRAGDTLSWSIIPSVFTWKFWSTMDTIISFPKAFLYNILSPCSFIYYGF